MGEVNPEQKTAERRARQTLRGARVRAKDLESFVFFARITLGPVSRNKNALTLTSLMLHLKNLFFIVKNLPKIPAVK